MTAATAAAEECHRPRRKRLTVAVIGAGAAGLAAAHELVKEGHTPVVYEQARQLGGTWVLDEQVESDLLGRDPCRTRVHSSMYRSLRTNLPREIMGYLDFPFPPQHMLGKSVDSRRFPKHEEVLNYLEAFAEKFDLLKHVWFGRTVVQVAPVPDLGAGAHATPDAVSNSSTQWKLRHKSSGTKPGVKGSGCGKEPDKEGGDIVDAVMVCNGHFSQPRLPSVPGFDRFPGVCEHSHSYRSPERFAGKVVVVVGAHGSGTDISLEISKVASKVYLSAAKSIRPTAGGAAFGASHGIHNVGWIQQLHEDGSVSFENDERVSKVDAVMFCTGYNYVADFLPRSVVSTDMPYVEPVYEHLFHPAYAGRLTFIGLPASTVPFPQMQLQAKLVARVLSGSVQLPMAAPEQWEWIKSFAGQFKDSEKPLRHMHVFGDAHIAYSDWLACCSGEGAAGNPAWRKKLWSHVKAVRGAFPEDYRNKWWDDPDTEAAVCEALA